MKKQLLFAFGAAALLASCSNDIDSPVANVKDGYLHVNATINELKTRATATEFQSNDAIGVSEVEGEASNVQYTYSDGSFSSVDGIKVEEGTTPSFTAYYPYTANLNSGKISFDVTNQTNVDFMFASEAQANVGDDNATVSFTFNHKMSQVAFEFVDQTYDESLADSDITITLNKVKAAGNFDTTNGSVEVTGEATGSIVLSSVDSEEGATVILPSYASENQDAIEIIVKVNDTNFKGNITPALTAGNQYKYTLTIKTNEPYIPGPDDPETEEFDLEISTPTVNGWTPADNVTNPELTEEYVLQIGDYLLNDGSTIAPKALTADNVNDVVAVVYYVGNPCPTNVTNYDEDKDILFNNFYKTSFSYKNVSEIDVTKHGLAISLEDANNGQAGRLRSNKGEYLSWFTANAETEYGKLLTGTGYNNQTQPKEFLGYNYTQFLKNAENESSASYITDKANLFTILDEYNQENNVDKASDWYLPSFAEFNQLIQVYDKVSASLTTLNKELKQYDSYSKGSNYTPKGNNFYWASDLRNNSNQWVSELNSVQTREEEDELVFQMWVNPNQGSTEGFFRFAIAF